jgi:hypothetical protein
VTKAKKVIGTVLVEAATGAVKSGVETLGEVIGVSKEETQAKKSSKKSSSKK